MNNTGFLTTPIGVLQIDASAKGVTQISFIEEAEPPKPTHSSDLIDSVKQQLEDYFNGSRREFKVPIDVRGTEFQASVWQQLRTIPYGTTSSYAEMANKLQHPKAVRAVGAANGRNPVSIIVPCHRVIGSNGSLTGYAWGLERKKWLLQHEKTTH